MVAKLPHIIIKIDENSERITIYLFEKRLIVVQFLDALKIHIKNSPLT